MSGIIILTACFIFVKPPSQLPDLWTVLICIYCCVHFMAFSFVFHVVQFSLNRRQTDKFDFNFQSCLSQTNLREKNE